MRIMLACLVAAVALAAPALAETRSYNITGFKKIEADAAFKIEFVQGSAWSVVVDSRYNNLDKIIVEKVGDTLRISRPEHTNLKGKVEDIIRITAPDLDALDLHSAIKFTAGNLNLDALQIDAEAAVVIEIGNLKTNTLNIDADAATKISIAAGSCTKLNVVLGAASHVDADNFKCRETNIDAGAASSVHAYASEKAVAKAGVASSVVMSGKPRTFEKMTDKFASTVSLAD